MIRANRIIKIKKMKKLLVCIICISSFCYHVKAQEETNNNETALEKDIKVLISKNGNFSKFKKDKIDSYSDLVEYSTNLPQRNPSYKLSVFENSSKGTSTFVYEISQHYYDAALFNLELETIFLDKTKGFTKSIEKRTEGILDGIIKYKGEVVGFIETEEIIKNELNVLLFIGTFKIEDIRTCITAKILANMKLDDFTKPESTSNAKPKVSKNVLNSLDKLTKSVDNFEKEKTKNTLPEKPKFDIEDFIKGYDNSTKSTDKEKTNFEKMNDAIDKYDKDQNKNDSNKIYISKAPLVAIEIFMSQFDTKEIDELKRSITIENLQNAILKLLEQRKIGFNNLKKEEKSKINNLTYYYAEPNVPLSASSIYISEKNGKNAYCAYYKSNYEKELISKAFFNLPTFKKSSQPLRFEESQVVRKNMTVFDLYISNHKLGSYIIFNDINESSIQLYEDGY